MGVQVDRVKHLKNQGRVTISDVSEALGITKSTVSRALNDYTDIAEGTRLRVRRMADAMGYQPLSLAQAIRTGRSKSLGLVIQLADHDAQRPFLAEFLAGLTKGASAKGWTLTIAATNSPEATIETFQTMIGDRKADGFILPRTEIDDPRVDLLRQASVPFVLFGRSIDPTDCAWFDVLGEEAMRAAVRHLYELGHRRIGFINGGMRYTYGPLRREGYLTAMAELGLEFDPSLMRQDAMTRADGAKAASEILRGDLPPTAILCAVDKAAIGAYQAIDELGMHVGHEVSVIGYDGIPEGASVSPQLSTFAVDYTACGERLSTMLIQRVLGESPENLRETVHASFLDRGSVGPPKMTAEELQKTIKQHG